jgi:Virulence factor
MPRHRNEVVVIMWRDIPAQVNGQSGRHRHQVMLDAKFERAIDRAKRKARIVTAHDEVAQWRRVSTPCDGDPVAAAQEMATRLDAEYSAERLGRIAYNGGVDR